MRNLFSLFKPTRLDQIIKLLDMNHSDVECEKNRKRILQFDDFNGMSDLFDNKYQTPCGCNKWLTS
jgi:hypothetical protein